MSFYERFPNTSKIKCFNLAGAVKLPHVAVSVINVRVQASVRFRRLRKIAKSDC